ncbi:BACON domain-containing protein [Alistipes ihumii]|uniref:BACON domain-containing protein n=1 Tax=Alistipes ihumii TaxID=1470347 RepID=UPI003AB71CBB
MMKMSILYSLFAVCSLAFCQCDKDGGSASGGNLPFELSVSQWNVPSQGATEEVDLQAPGEWKVKTDYIAGGERWLSVSKTSGAAGQHKLTLSAGNNPSNSTDREALLTVTCGNEQKTISVTQRTHEEVVPEQGRYDVKAGDTLLTVNVSANVAYQCSIVQEGNWIAQVQNKSAMETSSVRFQISANTDEQERTAVVKFTADNLAPTEITIVQAGQTAGKELTLFQLNIWEECGHNSTDGYSAFQSLVDQIVALEPDFATFCELYKNGDDMVMKKLVAALKERGLTYYAETGFGKGGGGARGLLSKYPIEETELINSWMFKGVCNVDGKRIAIYPSHSKLRLLFMLLSARI